MRQRDSELKYLILAVVFWPNQGAPPKCSLADTAIPRRKQVSHST